MVPTTVYLVTSKTTGVTLSVYTTMVAAQADVDAVDDGRCVVPWTLKDGYMIGRLRDVRL